MGLGLRSHDLNAPPPTKTKALQYVLSAYSATIIIFITIIIIIVVIFMRIIILIIIIIIIA